MNRFLPACMAWLALLPALSVAASKTLSFAGYTWTVKNGPNMGPGPNDWSDSDENAFVDSSGALHLKITNTGGKWYCAEVETTRKLGFGTYQFQLVSALDQFDKNIVLGLFKYPTRDVGPDGTNEIDIEFARWGIPTAPNGNYTVYPVTLGQHSGSRTFPFTLTGTYTTHRFTWTKDTVLFQSLHGHQNDNTNLYEEWLYQPTTPQSVIPQKPSPLFINLWLFNGKPPADGKDVEVVIPALSYRPLFGDMNGDGDIDGQDLNLLLRVYLGLDSATDSVLQVADARPRPGTGSRPFGDGKIGSDDVVWALQRYLGTVTEP